MLWTIVGASLAVVLIYESGVLENGLLAGQDQQVEFIITTMMEILTLACIPLALKLFKVEKVRTDLITRKAAGLRHWGVVRLGLLLVPLFADTLLYYMYMNTAFGYLAIILVLCLPFVYPTMNRCLAETEPTP